MQSTDIGPLIRIIMAVIAISMAIGQYDKLRAFAAHEAVKSSRGWKMVPFFAAPTAHNTKK
mgnify:CR=1